MWCREYASVVKTNTQGKNNSPQLQSTLDKSGLYKLTVFLVRQEENRLNKSAKSFVTFMCITPSDLISDL
jgi:hypothetical protein